MKNIPKRVCIYPKDIQLITGKSYRQSTRMLQQIRKELKKEKEHLITIVEFCKYTSINEEHVSLFIN
ncbi:MAG: hypothetical protein Q8J84_08745 [Flavobacteriaceae bacterium]|nr:hypothetical protein [Flavobacteriaceae bacterium]